MMDNFVKPVYAADLSKQFSFGNILSFGDGISRIIPLAFDIAAILVVFYFLLGAYDLIISSGDKNDIANARNRITHAIIGFVLLIFVFLVLQFLPCALGLTSFQIIGRTSC